MTREADVAEFRRTLQQHISRFRATEPLLREQFARQPESVSGEVAEGLLERTTRRFLIDGLLASLGWDPGDPLAVVEEARSLSDEGGRLYFDYLGVSTDRNPVLLISTQS